MDSYLRLSLQVESHTLKIQKTKINSVYRSIMHQLDRKKENVIDVVDLEDMKLHLSHIVNINHIKSKPQQICQDSRWHHREGPGCGRCWDH